MSMFYERIEEVEIPKTITGRVAIKLHMGEAGNKTYVSPSDVRVIFEKIKANGGTPFLFDTTTLYEHRRYTVKSYHEVAKEHGFGGFPVVIGSDTAVKKVHGYGISRKFLEADAVVFLSHGKGHIFTAFGGAVKNIGMGCVNKDGKRRIHNPNQPKHVPEKCAKCGACVEACQENFIQMDDDGVKVNHVNCAGCGACVKACKVGAMLANPESVENSFTQFAVAARAVLSQFPKDKIFYVTVLKNITKWCDCASDPGEIVCPDIGYLADTDPVRIDAEAIRLIKAKRPKALDFKTWNLFEKIAREVLENQKSLSHFRQNLKT
jgi:uncharacterized Fe-S center protein